MQDYAKLEQRVAALMEGTYKLQRWDGITMLYVKDGVCITIKHTPGVLKHTLSAKDIMQMETLKVEL